ncbi:hypothetical protein ABPG75_008377 [Micractinium tetrahymenae]
MADFEDDSSLLALLLDVSPAALSCLASTPGLGLQSLLEQLLTFVNTFLLLNDANRLAVFTAGAAGCQLAYCSSSCLPPAVAGPAAVADAAWPPSASVLSGLQQAVTAVAQAATAAGVPPAAGAACQLSSALSRALCFINSQQRRTATALPGGGPLPEGPDAGGGGGGAGPGQRAQAARVLVLAAAPDAPSQYIAVMNAIFSSQRSNVIIDACHLGQGHSAFLQQAAHLTGGVYLRPTKPQALVQYLNSVFTLDAGTRALLRLPGAAQVDFRPSCFCHKRQIDLGFVCSACLSIFCEQLPACTTCGTEFEGKQK